MGRPKIKLFLDKSISPAQSIAADLDFMSGAKSSRTPILRVYTYPDDVVLMGRFHRMPLPPNNTRPGVMLVMRQTGGRVFPSGQGFVQFSLILPHQSFLLSDDPQRIAPFQILNRYVRPFLQGLKALRYEAFYPGLDFLTIGRRPVGWLSFVTDETGVLLCEGGLFLSRDMSALSRFLEVIDPGGSVHSNIFLTSQTTTLEEERGQPFSLDDVVELLTIGFQNEYGLDCLEQTDDYVGTPPRHKQILQKSVGFQPPLPHTDFSHSATMRTVLGELEVQFSLTSENTIRDISFSGDIIADPEGLHILETNLKDCPLEIEAIGETVNNAYLPPNHYLIGAGKLDRLPELILRGTRRHEPAK